MIRSARLRRSVVVLGWILAAPFYAGWVAGIISGYPFNSQVPLILLPAAFLLFLGCYRSRVAAAMVVTLVIPTAGVWILNDHSEDAREELARGEVDRAVGILERQTTSWFYRFPTGGHAGIYLRLSKAYNIEKRYGGAGVPLAAVRAAVARQAAFDTALPMTAFMVDRWLEHARLMEDDLFAPNQAMRIYTALANAGLPPEAKIDVLAHHVAALQRRFPRE